VVVAFRLRRLDVTWGFGQVRALLIKVSARLMQLGLEERSVEPRDDLTLLDDRIEVGAEPLDVARHLTADLDRRHGLQRSGGADRVDDVAASDRRGLHLNFGAAATHVDRTGARSDGTDDQQADDYAFHVTPSQLI